MNYYERVAKTVGLTLLLVTLVGTAIALFVLVPDAFFLIFLSILFAVLLAHTAAYVQRWIPLGYSWSLAIVVLLLIAGTIASGWFFGSTVQQQAQRTSQQLDQASEKLGAWLEQHPTAREALIGVPVVGRAVEELTGPQQHTEEQSQEQPPAERKERPRQESSSETRTADSSQQDADRQPRDAADGQSVSAGADTATASQQDATSTAAEKSTVALPRQALSIISQIFSTTFGALTSLAIILFVGLYLAVDPQLYCRGLLGLFPPDSQARAAHVLRRLDTMLFHWLIGTILTMTITGLGTGLGLWFLGVPLAGTVAAITALLAFIPNLGAVLALCLAMLAAISQGANTVLWVVGLYLLLQLIESNVITPLIQQHQTSIPPALLVAFQLLVGMLTGFVGLIVATPLLAALMVIVDELWYTEADDVL